MACFFNARTNAQFLAHGSSWEAAEGGVGVKVFTTREGTRIGEIFSRSFIGS